MRDILQSRYLRSNVAHKQLARTSLKDSRQFFNQCEVKPKPIAPCTRDFSRASSELQVIARNFYWFMALFVPVVIGQSNYFVLVFRQSFENRSNGNSYLAFCFGFGCRANHSVSFERCYMAGPWFTLILHFDHCVQ